MNTRNKNGVTLAEVLITLGILGVVIAMTLPSLIQKYQVHVVETRLKKFYSIMNQAILLAKNKHGDFEGWSYWIDEEYDEDGNRIERYDEINTAFKMYLEEYLNIITVKEVTDASGQKRYLYELADGSSFMFPIKHNREIIFFPSSHAEKCLELEAAERYGNCAFLFEFYPLKNTSDWKYLYQKGYEPYFYQWDGKEESLYTGARYSCDGDSPYYCSAIIARNGWKVPKDYPRKIRW